MEADPTVKHSYSSLATWRRCKYKFHLANKLRIQTAQGVGQKRGSAGHAAMEHYYRNDRDPVAAIEYAWEKYTEGNPEPNLEDWNLLEGCLQRYFKYAAKNDKFDVKEVEWKFELDIEGHTLKGFIDGVVEENGSTWLLEHKFNKRVSTTHLDYDPQVSVYLLAATLYDMEPAGVIYNIVRVDDGPTALKQPVVRKRVYRSSEGLVYFVKEMLQQMQEVEKFLQEPEDVIPYRTLTPDCNWDCQFLKVCMELNDSGSADHLIAKMGRGFK